MEGQSKYQNLAVLDKTKTHFKYANETIEIENKQTNTPTYAKEILSKKATKIVFTIKRLLSNIDSSAVETRNKLFDVLVKPMLLYGCEIWGPELISYKTHFDKSTIEQVHIKFCKQTLNVPWYTENKACRAELGPYPLSIDIKASVLCYWQRLEQKSDNPLLNEAFNTKQYKCTTKTR